MKYRRVLRIILLAGILILLSTCCGIAEYSYGDSGLHYYYDQLTSFEKSIYNQLLAIDGDEDEEYLFFRKTTSLSYQQFYTATTRAYDALIADHPRFAMYWDKSPGDYLDRSSDYVLVITSPGNATEYLQDKSDYIIRDILSRIDEDADRYTMVQEMAAILERETVYDYSSLKASFIGKLDSNAHSAIGVFAYQTAVCEGYAEATKILCDELGIPCIVVSNEGHSWNYVQMEDGCWYAVDNTTPGKTDGGLYAMLQGSEDPDYTRQERYREEISISDAGDFTYPELSADTYQYQKDYTGCYRAGTAYQEPAGRLIYRDNDDGTCSILAYEGEGSGNLVVPGTLGGMPVTRVEDGAFLRCVGFSGTIQIAEGVTEIGSSAFVGLKEMSSLSLPDSLETIGTCAFADCFSLESVVIPKSVRKIGAYAFSMEASSSRKNLRDIYVYNPEVSIDDKDSTTLGVPGLTTVHGYSGSTAEAYALANGYRFAELTGEDGEEQENPLDPDILPGDVNEDGVVDGRDAVRLMKYLADETDPETGLVFEIGMDNADVTGDGEVDGKDLLRLVQYLGGEDVTLEQGKVTSVR